MERITGVLEGRRGSFVLQHGAAQGADGTPLQFGWIVPESGTGELAGIAGSARVAHERPTPRLRAAGLSAPGAPRLDSRGDPGDRGRDLAASIARRMAKVRAMVAALAAVTLVAAGGAASAAVARGDAIEVVSPQQDGTQRGTARVELRLAAGARGFAATVNRTAVTSRFARRGTTRTATLAAGAATGVRYGLTTLRLRAVDRRGRADVHVLRFALVRRDGRLLTVAAPRRSAGGATVRLRLRDPRGPLGTARRPYDRPPRGRDSGRDAAAGEGACGRSRSPPTRGCASAATA